MQFHLKTLSLNFCFLENKTYPVEKNRFLFSNWRGMLLRIISVYVNYLYLELYFITYVSELRQVEEKSVPELLLDF